MIAKTEILCDFRSIKDSQYKSFTSWKIQNEVLELMAHNITRKLCDKIRAEGSSGIVVDGTTVIKHREHDAI